LFYKQVLLWVMGGGGFHDNWDFGSQEILSSLKTFTNEAERTLDLPGVAIDVVKVQGEDLDTPGYLRGDMVRLGRRRSRIVGASPLARSR